MLQQLHLHTPPAVVPIFVNAGAALLPALLAGITSIAALLFRPRELLAALFRHPLRFLSFLAILGIAIFLITTTLRLHAAPPAPPDATDWVAVARAIDQSRNTPRAILKPLWHNSFDGELALATPAILSPPGRDPILFAPGMINTFEKQAGTFWALNANTGTPLWKATRAIPIGSASGPELRAIFSRPAISADGTRVITGQGLHADTNCSLLCFDIAASAAARNGRTVWSVPTALHIESSPALFRSGGNEYAIIGAGAIEGPDRKPQGDPGFLFCVSVATGKVIWRYALNDPEASVAIDDAGIVYAGAGLNGNAVVALRSLPDAELSGKSRLLWRTPTPFPATGDLALAKDPRNPARQFVLLGIGNGDFVDSGPKPAGAVFALDSRDGSIAWQTPLPDGVLGRLSIQSDRVLAPCRDGNVYALNLATGTILWKTRISTAASIPVLSGVATDKRFAYAIAADGTLAVLTLDTGAIIERRTLADPAKTMQNYTMAAPVLWNKTLFVCTETDGIHAFQITW